MDDYKFDEFANITSDENTRDRTSTCNTKTHKTTSTGPNNIALSQEDSKSNHEMSVLVKMSKHEKKT